MAVNHPYARELGDFLRTRRGRLRPQDVGLGLGGRLGAGLLRALPVAGAVRLVGPVRRVLPVRLLGTVRSRLPVRYGPLARSVRSRAGAVPGPVRYGLLGPVRSAGTVRALSVRYGRYGGRRRYGGVPAVRARASGCTRNLSTPSTVDPV